MITTSRLIVSTSVCAFGLILVSGCAMQEKKEETTAKSIEAKPINCQAAPANLRMLDSEKANLATKIGNGVSMVVPLGLVEGFVTGTEETKYQVSTGEYNQTLDAAIAKIKAACPGAQAD